MSAHHLVCHDQPRLKSTIVPSFVLFIVIQGCTGVNDVVI